MSSQLPLIVGGLATGTIYAVIALGFVIIFKSSHTLNFAHLALMLLGGYLVYQSTQFWGLSFAVGVVVSIVLSALLAVALYLLIAAPLVGRPLLAVLIGTLGADIALRTLITSYQPWAVQTGVDVGSPWGSDTVTIAGANLYESNLWFIAAGTVLVVALFLTLQRSRWGLLFRAIAENQEAAAANGVPVRTVLLGVWAASGVLAALGGVAVGTFPRLLAPTSAGFALRSLPAVVIGGFDSIHGAIVGGIIVGLAEVYTARYAPAALGANFHLLVPYLLMVLVLIVRPHGLFGTPEVRRV